MRAELFAVFGRIGLLSFGGPAAQIALMHRELVENRDWLTEEQFLRALSFCMLLPGPEAMQLATYAGWKRAGFVGGLISGGLFVIPGAIVIALLALSYGAYRGLPLVQSLFLGVKATVVVIVIDALIRVSKRALIRRVHHVIAVVAFVALFLLALPFPLVIAAATLAGAMLQRDHSNANSAPPVNLLSSLRVILIGLVIWFAPLLPIALAGEGFLLDVGGFFAKLAVVTFGGAYAVLAYMTQEVVVSYGWLTTAEMIDALGLAETTPGPLILVTQFVAMIAGLSEGGVSRALAAGILTLWVTFVPCFVWIFAGAPLIDWVEGRPRLGGALAGITAAVVGVIGNLSVWFALYVFFDNVNPVQWGILNTIMPEIDTAQPLTIGLALFAGCLLIGRHWPLPLVLFITALISVGLASVTGAI